MKAQSTKDRSPSPARPQHTSSGMTLPEVMVSLCVIGIGFLAIWTSSGQCLQMARAHRETSAATETLMQRVEACRAAGWNTIVSAAGIRDNVLQNAVADAAALQGVEEQITITAYPPVSPAPVPIIVRRRADGTVQIVSEPAPAFYLRSTLAVRADFSTTWKSAQNQRPRRREATTVISVQALLR